MSLRAFLSTCFLAGVMAQSVAGDACDNPVTCLQRVAEMQRRVRSLSARFVQIKRLGLLAEPLQSTGRVAFEYPDTILWKVDDPPFEFEIDRGRVRLPEGQERELDVATGLPSVFTAMAAIFTGDEAKLLAAFEVDARHDGGGIVVTLRPKPSRERRVISLVQLRFAEPDLELREVHIAEALGDRLDITFHDVQRTLATP